MYLKEARKRKKITQEQLAKRLGVTRSAVSMWEIGAAQPDNDILIMLSRILDISVDALLGTSSGPHKTQIPVYGRVAAGIPIEAIEDVIDVEEITPEMAKNGRHIALQIHGDSMEPRMREGDVVIVRLQDDAETGDTAVVMVNGTDATCKKIKKTPDGILLISTNPAYEPMYYSNAEISSLPVRILGRVVELRAKF